MEKFHEHDCECCHYLGSEKKKKEELDYYVCDQGDKRPTVIARFGVDGDYYSGLFPVKGYAMQMLDKQQEKTLAEAVLSLRKDKSDLTPLIEATARAIEQGFLDENLNMKTVEKKLKM